MTVNQKLCKNIVFNTSRNTFWIFVRIDPLAILTNIQNMFCEEIRTKQGLPYILLIKDSLQQQMDFSGNIFGNKCCSCNEGSLYFISMINFLIEASLCLIVFFLLIAGGRGMGGRNWGGGGFY